MNEIVPGGEPRRPKHKKPTHTVSDPGTTVLDSPDMEIRKLFDSLDSDADGQITADDLLSRLGEAGITSDDPRARELLRALQRQQTPIRAHKMAFEDFREVARHGSSLIRNAVTGNLVIPEFAQFRKELMEDFEAVSANVTGRVADYIPQLARVNPEHFALSVCTVDGQRIALGDTDVPFCVQSVSKPINYCLALEEHGEAKVHKHIGREPSGRGFNELTLNNDGLPHNPMINSGAIMCCSLIRPEDNSADKFDHVLKTWGRLVGHHGVGFNNPVYLSERLTADRNFALGYFMREKGAFPPNTDLLQTLEFYFQCCSIELNANALSVVAASLANGGLCPMTGERIFQPRTVQNCLSLMSSCGLYDFSGEFAFSIGLPAKSGVSGALMLIIPGVMGVAVWSPRLDKMGNTVRGVEISRRLVERYNFHTFDSLTAGESKKRDPRLKRNQSEIENIVTLCWAASQGDLREIQRLAACGVDLNAADYDGRTALHLAASEGHTNVIEFLLSRDVVVDPKDRWGGTPYADAVRGKHEASVRLLEPRTALK